MKISSCKGMNEHCTYKTFPELCEEVTVVGISACTDIYSIHGPKSNIQCTLLLLNILVLEGKNLDEPDTKP